MNFLVEALGASSVPYARQKETQLVSGLYLYS